MAPQSINLYFFTTENISAHTNVINNQAEECMSEGRWIFDFSIIKYHYNLIHTEIQIHPSTQPEQKELRAIEALVT